MSSVGVLNIIPKNPITKFTDAFSFEIVIEVLSELKKEIEWKMVYITSEDQKYDQILNEIEIDPPSQLGQMKFEFVGEAPDITKIPENDVVGVAAILRIHRAMADARLLANPASWSRVADSSPN